MKKILLILAIGLTLVSCNKEDIQPNVTPAYNGVTVKLSCSGQGNGYSFIDYTKINDTIQIREYHNNENLMTVDSVDWTKYVYVQSIVIDVWGESTYSGAFQLYKDDVIIDSKTTLYYHSYSFQKY